MFPLDFLKNSFPSRPVSVSYLQPSGQPKGKPPQVIPLHLMTYSLKLNVTPCTALLTLLPFLIIMWAILDEEQPESPFTLFTKLVLQNSQIWEKQGIESPAGALFPVSSHSHTLLIHTHTPASQASASFGSSQYAMGWRWPQVDRGACRRFRNSNQT